MRKTQFWAPLALVALVVPALASAEENKEEWKEQSFKDCRCSAQFPGTPQEKTTSTQTQLGSLDTTLITLDVPGVAFYALAFVDYPRDKVTDKNPDNLLDGARDGAVKKVKGQLIKETKVTMNGSPGRELRIEAPGGMVLHARIYMVRERLYQALVVVPTARADAAENKKFLDSFKFQKP
ncbi:MAG TPA: hypothetical protein VGJ32_17460 [Solirubrobacteraceae bacterium]